MRSKYDRAVKKLKPKKGDLVSVCYDGKWGRALVGKVVQTRGFAIQVEFPEYGGDENVVTAWFVRTSPTSYGAFVKVEQSIMRGLFGLPGDWYTVLHIDVYRVMFPRKKVFYNPARFFAGRKRSEKAWRKRQAQPAKKRRFRGTMP